MTATLNRSIGFAAFPLNPYYQTGKELSTVGYKKTFPTTGNIGDQYVLAGPLSLDDRISRIIPYQFAALTSATTWNLGFYKSTDNVATLANLTPVVSGGGNELWSGVSLASAPTLGQDLLVGKNSALDNTKAIRDLLNIGPDVAPVGGIFLVLTNTTTANTAGGVVDLDIQIEEATTR
jgi:hypothetical protein